MSFLATLLGSLMEGLSEDQKKALDLLTSDRNVFVTGGAGTGKSYLMKKFMSQIDSKKFPLLASTGAAAVLVGGRTFHSYFGLGIMEGGPRETVDRAVKNKRVRSRLRKATGIVLDEVSMISGETLATAEEIARQTRESNAPWGGLRVIAVGDFSQLPPVSQGRTQKDWAFQHDVWKRSDFANVVLREMMRTRDEGFWRILNDVRVGSVSKELREFLESRTSIVPEKPFDGTVLYGRRADVDRINLEALEKLPAQVHRFETIYTKVNPNFMGDVRVNFPLPEVLEVKEEALVMLRQNDPEGRWVNGSLGHVKKISSSEIQVELLSGALAKIKMATFSQLDAEGQVVASATNFPLTLAYAMTIHKAQGATLDRVRIDLRELWEPGQAYVALSRVKHGSGIFLEAWSERSIIADPFVKKFHESLSETSLS
jgi:ATP-dependent DNA helicase PIF1